jgi:hypothetical protein
MGELGPMFASKRDVPNDSFFSFISEKIRQYFQQKDCRMRLFLSITFERNSLPAGDDSVAL